MNGASHTNKGCEGRLPAMAPLANPYVPFQLDDPPRYEPRMALVRGTLYPGLDLPFMGMVNQQEQPITPTTELQALGFMIQELTLYLDTHREDKEALEILCEYQKLYEDAQAKYEKNCGPLTIKSADCCGEYRWLCEPWPWEYAANRGV